MQLLISPFELIKQTTPNEILGWFYLSSLLYELRIMTLLGRPVFITINILTLHRPVLKLRHSLIEHLLSLHSNTARYLLLILYLPTYTQSLYIVNQES